MQVMIMLRVVSTKPSAKNMPMMRPLVAPNARMMPDSSVRRLVCIQKVPMTPKQRLMRKKMDVATERLKSYESIGEAN